MLAVKLKSSVRLLAHGCRLSGREGVGRRVRHLPYASMGFNAVVAVVLQRLHAIGSRGGGGSCTALTVRLYGVDRVLVIHFTSSLRSLAHGYRQWGRKGGRLRVRHLPYATMQFNAVVALVL